MIQTTEKCRFKACSAPLVWATTPPPSGQWIPLNAEPVDPGHRGALVLIGGVAFSLVPATVRIREMFGCSEIEALDKAYGEYAWHLAHFATCPFRDQARQSRRR